MVSICVKSTGRFWISEKTVLFCFLNLISVFLKILSNAHVSQLLKERKNIVGFISCHTWNQVEIIYVHSTRIHIVPFPFFTEIKGNNIGKETDSDTFRNRQKET